MKPLQTIVVSALALAMAALVGCSKPAPEETPAKPVTGKKIEFPGPTNLVSAQPAVSLPDTTATPAPAAAPAEDRPRAAARSGPGTPPCRPAAAL